MTGKLTEPVRVVTISDTGKIVSKPSDSQIRLAKTMIYKSVASTERRPFEITVENCPDFLSNLSNQVELFNHWRKKMEESYRKRARQDS